MTNDAIINGKTIKISEEERLDAEKFHLNRIKFAIINDTVIFGNADGDDRDHQHWLLEDYKIAAMEFEFINRGYILKNKIHLYVGSSFKPVNLNSITMQQLSILIECHNQKYGCGKIDVFSGAEVGKIGEIWKPVHKLFTIV